MPFSTSDIRPRSFVVAIIQLVRPKEWIKNVFVVVPLVFSGNLVNPAGWRHSLMALVAFCLGSAATYALNDAIDATKDSAHPRKRYRPVASGAISIYTAASLSVLLAIAAVAVALTLNRGLAICVLAYLTNSLLYCLFFKRHEIVDVLAIAIGFVIRLLGGCAALSIEPTSWVVVCGFSLALVLGFGKRRLEVSGLRLAADYRPVLSNYQPDKLNLLLGISASMCLLSYMQFTVAPSTVLEHGTDKLVYTVPFVAYGIFRYLFKVQEGKHDGPVEVLSHDPVFAINAILWAIAVVLVLYVLPTKPH